MPGLFKGRRIQRRLVIMKPEATLCSSFCLGGWEHFRRLRFFNSRLYRGLNLRVYALGVEFRKVIEAKL